MKMSKIGLERKPGWERCSRLEAVLSHVWFALAEDTRMIPMEM